MAAGGIITCIKKKHDPVKHTLLSICLLCLIAVAPASAKGVKFNKVDASGAKITAVSASSISFESAKVNHTYKITAATQIRVDGRKAGAADLKKGMHVGVTAGQLDPTVAMAIEASSSSGR